ncbi:MAG: hypothetical protein HOP02_07430 [Methylococcaceae bacterium]|nr:hypothetical protein [Methylococcaceae bacterium]
MVKSKRLFHTVLTMYLMPTAIITAFCLIGLYTNGFAFRFNDKINAMDAALKSDPNKSKCLGRYQDFEQPLSDQCKAPATPELAKVLLLGDSHANHLSPFLKYMAKEKNYSFDEYTLNACLALFDLNYGGNEYQFTHCRKRNDLVKALLKNRYDYVILAGSWPAIGNQFIFSESRKKMTDNVEMAQLVGNALSHTIKYITALGAKVILVEDLPGTGHVIFSCSIKQALFNKPENCIAQVPKNIWFDQILANLPPNSQYSKIGLRGLLCRQNLCQIDIDGIPLYRDSSHLNNTGSEMLAKKYQQQFGNFFTIP